MKKILILLIMTVMVFSVVTPAFANQSTQQVAIPEKMGHLTTTQQETIYKHIENFDVDKAITARKLSKESRELVKQAFKDQKKALKYAIIENGENIVILSTNQDNVEVTITNNVIDVVEQVDENNYLINGEEHYFEISISSEEDLASFPEIQREPIRKFEPEPDPEMGALMFSGWLKSGTKPGPWTVNSSRWVNINATRDFSSFTAGALGSVIAYYIAGAFAMGPVGAVATGIGISAAYAFTAAYQYRTNVGKAYVTFARNGPYPTSAMRAQSYNYAVMTNKNYYINTTTTYYIKCIACGAV